ncbi:MAG: radical SAM protein [archaeon]|nr:radical SAM protein [archaeon]
MENLIHMCDLTHTAQGYIASDYVPYGIGGIKSWFKGYSKYKEMWDIELFRYPEKFIDTFLREQPEIVAFSNYIWNTDLSKSFADEVKRRNPNTLVVFGGPNYPLDDDARERWFADREGVDVYLVGEAEESFQRVVELWNETRDIEAVKRSQIDGVHSFVDGKLRKVNEVIPRIPNLDLIPSPYLTGCLDEFLEDERLIPIIQTDRGCPYTCTYCDKGTKIWKKLSKKSPDIFEQEIRYIGARTKSKVIDLSNNNFGLFEQDVILSEIMKKTRDEIGYPLHVGTPTDKNFSPRIERCVEILGESLPITASVQSLDPEVLRNIKRKNLPIEKFLELSRLADSTNSNTRSEVIIALPGDTKEKYVKTMSQLMDSRMQFVLPYTLILLEGAELNTREEREKWNMETRFRLNHHCFGKYQFGDKEIRTAEIEEVVTGSSALSFEDYLECRSFGLTTFTFYADNMLQELLSFLNDKGIRSSELISAVHNRGWCYFSPELTGLYHSFNNATRDELWVSREGLEKHVKSLKVMKKETEGLVGYNILYQHRAMALMNLSEDIINVSFNVATDLLDETTKRESAEYLEQLRKYMIYRKRNIFDINREDIEEFDYNFDELAESNFEGEPRRRDNPLRIKFYHTENQKKQFDGFTPDLEGAMRMIPKISLVNIIRSVEIVN